MRAVASAHTTYSPDIVAPNGVAFRVTWRVWPSAVNSTERWLSSIAKTGPPYVAVERIAALELADLADVAAAGVPDEDPALVGAERDRAAARGDRGDGVALQPGQLGLEHGAGRVDVLHVLPRLSQAAPASEPEKPAARVTSGWTVSITALSEPTVRVTRPRRSSDMIASPAKATSSASGLADSDGPPEPPSEVAAAYPAKSEVAAQVEPEHPVAGDRRVQLGLRRGGDGVPGQLARGRAAGADLVGVEDLAGGAQHHRVQLGVDDHLLDAARASTKLLVGVSRVASAP